MDLLKGAKATLAVVAPALASAFGTPVAGAAVSAIIGALGLAPDATEEQAATAVVGATAAQLIELQKADKEFALSLKQLEIDAAKLTYDDKANARAREAAVKDHTPAILAAGLTVGFFGLLSVMLFHAVPDGSSTLLNVMLGSLGSSFGMMVAYYYGASAPQPGVKQ